MKESVKSVVVLTCICLVVSVLLAAVNHVTAPIIEQSASQAAFESCYLVMPEAGSFEELTADALPEGLPATITAAYRETNGLGYVFEMTTTGYSADLVVICGIASDGTITGTTILSSNETPSIGGQCAQPAYTDQYIGKTSALEGVTAISGATMTSNGFKNAVLDAFTAFYAVSGGSMTYSEDQLIEMALPGIGTATEMAATELPAGVDAIFTGERISGFVCRATVGTTVMYVGYDLAGTQTGVAFNDPDGVLSAEFSLDATAANDTETQLQQIAASLPDALASLTLQALQPTLQTMLPDASSYTPIELAQDFYRETELKTEYDGTKSLNAAVVSAWQADTGAMAFLMKAQGQHDGMYVLCALDAQGAIAGTQMLADGETQNIMSGMYEDAYLQQFIGKTDLEQSVLVSGATVSGTAYNMAIRCAFDAYASLQPGGATPEGEQPADGESAGAVAGEETAGEQPAAEDGTAVTSEADGGDASDASQQEGGTVNE